MGSMWTHVDLMTCVTGTHVWLLTDASRSRRGLAPEALDRVSTAAAMCCARRCCHEGRTCSEKGSRNIYEIFPFVIRKHHELMCITPPDTQTGKHWLDVWVTRVGSEALAQVPFFPSDFDVLRRTALSAQLTSLFGSYFILACQKAIKSMRLPHSFPSNGTE